VVFYSLSRLQKKHPLDVHINESKSLKLLQKNWRIVWIIIIVKTAACLLKMTSNQKCAAIKAVVAITIGKKCNYWNVNSRAPFVVHGFEIAPK
jgi:hypothetical protein